MDTLVDHAQSAFLKGRCILDNFAIAEEAIFSMHKRRLNEHILKVDFSKAFDSVDWDFLLELLRVRGFGSRWLGWINSILSSSKASILINGSPSGYVRYQRGLRQGDPLSPLLFVLVSDVLCTMFDNALNSHVLIGVPLGEYGSICNLYYADDLLVLTVGGAEDLRVIKLILLVFEGLSGLETNFSKTFTYLGIPVSGRRPRKQDWEKLVISVLSAVPTYWMSLFRLPPWVIKKINRIQRDFLWSGADIDKPRCRLVAWKNICCSKEQGGWGILDLSSFNLALLGKWRWKLLVNPHWRGVKILRFNYKDPIWDLYKHPRGRISYFWSGVSRCLLAFRECVTVHVKSGSETLFWKDRWFNGLAPMYIWAEEFLVSPRPNGTIRELAFLLTAPRFASNSVTRSTCLGLNLGDDNEKDQKLWSLTANGSFSVKSFYCRLNEGGLRCPLANVLCKGPCPRKVNILNWLVWKNKVLSLKNLARRRCNKLRTDTCVLCHSGVESVDHLFLNCQFSKEVWESLVGFLQLPVLPPTISLLWGDWRLALRLENRVFGVWTTYLLLSWFSAATEGLREQLTAPISAIRRSLEFEGPRSEGLVATHMSEEDQVDREE
ncbi:uncharacterized protein LOC120271557 [Dioscorea cayenensis subsp. rotundata]|uniref:Uncharacterized protein LOC120271557 n=1 Tax=Dioscorea cayennensis subsp. rotundata TaxID=55577 RepID=A0AB40C319_DIOCR|nr:uncharacterized protein LOC120271557 [Dioscorea cayenensis subsp. rotundata]